MRDFLPRPAIAPAVVWAFPAPHRARLSNGIELMIFGGLIVFFLIVEPHGLARLWQIAKEKLRLWPFPH